MEKEIAEIVEKIKWLIDSQDITLYKISKETGIAASTLNRYKHGKIPIEGISLETANKLLAFYNRLGGGCKVKKEVQEKRDKLFGRLLAVLDVFGARVGLRRDFIDYGRYQRRPMDTFTEANLRIMDCVGKFGDKECELLDRITIISNEFAYDEFSNDPLSSKFLYWMSKERNSLRDYLQ